MGTERQDNQHLLRDVATYYSGKIATHGAVPQGVDWNSKEGQDLRFDQLCHLFDVDQNFSLTDLGCGYGALVDYLLNEIWSFDYIGCDVSEAMIEAARQRFKGIPNVAFVVGEKPPKATDYCVASGIFNVRLGHSNDEWRNYIESTLDVMNDVGKRGFAFNCLTSYSDADKMRPDLYYANPGEIFDLCKRKYSRKVALLHDYDLYEFTILVRK